MDCIKFSVLDAIKQHFTAAETNSYIHKILYAGEHTFLEESEKQLTEHFTNVIKDINGDYCDAPVTGFLLIYQKYFVSIVEGSEETVSRQIRKFIYECENKEKFKRAKIIIIYHNVKERQFSGITCIFKIPPVLVSALSKDKSMDYYTQILETIIDKLERLTLHYTRKRSVTSILENTENVESKMDTFPEYALLDFLLSSQYSFELQWYAYMTDILPDYQYSYERCWPTPYDFTPAVNFERELADIFVDPLPKSIFDVEEEVEEEAVVVQKDGEEDEAEA